MQSPPFPRYLVPPRSKYSPQHHVLKHPQLPFLPQCQRPSFTPIGDVYRTYSKWKANCIGHIWRRNCLLKYVVGGKIEGRIEVMGRRVGRRKRLLDDLKERRGYCKLKEGAVDHTVCKTGSDRDCGPVVRQTVRNE